jgi:hypothetical protein
VAYDGVITEHFLARYRALLDAEGAAFDELEHAYEDGDREQFAADLEAWREAMARKVAFLERSGFPVQPAAALA